MDAQESAALQQARAETRAAFANRALVYLHLYETLVRKMGAEQARTAMRTAIYLRGREVAEKYRAAAESGDLEAVGRIFCEDSACDGELFEPGVEEVGQDHIVLRMAACPLLEAWREHGLSEDEIDTLCGIASAVDEGTFEGAGLDIEITERLGQPGADRCLLRIALRS